MIKCVEKAPLLGWCQAGKNKPDADLVNEFFLGTGEPFISLYSTAAAVRSEVTPVI